jgi:MarR family transcriptional regulator, organic hydroperoxide resistance regulator
MKHTQPERPRAPVEPETEANADTGADTEADANAGKIATRKHKSSSQTDRQAVSPEPTLPQTAQSQATQSQATQALAEDAIHKFLQLHRHLRQYALQMDHHGVRPREFSVLLFLLENDAATVGQVQEYLYHSPSTTSAILAQLEEAGYVTRTRSEADNRVVIVALTEKGRTVAQQGPMGGIPLLRRRLPTLSAQRLACINQALDDIMQLMEVSENP